MWKRVALPILELPLGHLALIGDVQTNSKVDRLSRDLAIERTCDLFVGFLRNGLVGVVGGTTGSGARVSPRDDVEMK